MPATARFLFCRDKHFGYHFIEGSTCLWKGSSDLAILRWRGLGIRSLFCYQESKHHLLGAHRQEHPACGGTAEKHGCWNPSPVAQNCGICGWFIDTYRMFCIVLHIWRMYTNVLYYVSPSQEVANEWAMIIIVFSTWYVWNIITGSIQLIVGFELTLPIFSPRRQAMFKEMRGFADASSFGSLLSWVGFKACDACLHFLDVMLSVFLYVGSVPVYLCLYWVANLNHRLYKQSKRWHQLEQPSFLHKVREFETERCWRQNPTATNHNQPLSESCRVLRNLAR